MSNEKSHINTGIRRILEIPFIYNLFQTLHGGNKKRELHFKQHFSDKNIKRILDIGCGSGVLLDHLSNDIEYHGCDMEGSYIEFARNKFGNRGNFYQEVVGQNIRKEWLGYFDAINAHGLLHHLNDMDCNTLLKTSHAYLKKGGFLVTVDPVFYQSQSKFSRWIVSKDRGQNIKTPKGYESLARQYFNTVEGKLVKKHNSIYYSVYIMKMSK